MGKLNNPVLLSRCFSGGQVTSEEGIYHLELPTGKAGRYRLAQLDDYKRLARRSFNWKAPFRLEVSARASAQTIPGTWGFGLWNDPFSLALLSKGELLRLPITPNAAWFFFASPPNYLTLQDDLPTQGWLAMTFSSPNLPLWLLGIPAFPLLLWHPTRRLLRHIGQRVVAQDAKLLECDPTKWHNYCLEWQTDRVEFTVDGKKHLSSQVIPRGRLAMVIWIDNQYFALPPSGQIGYGSLANPESAWIEIQDVRVNGSPMEISLESGVA